VNHAGPDGPIAPTEITPGEGGRIRRHAGGVVAGGGDHDGARELELDHRLCQRSHAVERVATERQVEDVDVLPRIGLTHPGQVLELVRDLHLVGLAEAGEQAVDLQPAPRRDAFDDARDEGAVTATGSSLWSPSSSGCSTQSASLPSPTTPFRAFGSRSLAARPVSSTTMFGRDRSSARNPGKAPTGAIAGCTLCPRWPVDRNFRPSKGRLREAGTAPGLGWRSASHGARSLLAAHP
jgi:hypothetical protein